MKKYQERAEETLRKDWKLGRKLVQDGETE
jgi:hypothetical protein